MAEIPAVQFEEPLIGRPMQIDVIRVGKGKLDLAQGVLGSRLLPNPKAPMAIPHHFHIVFGQIRRVPFDDRSQFLFSDARWDVPIGTECHHAHIGMKDRRSMPIDRLTDDDIHLDVVGSGTVSRLGTIELKGRDVDD